jgi:3-hydroxyacyl-[acyl-carrier-protein] dehydratase
MLDINQIQEIIPHRYPFLLIDRVDELEVGYRAKGIKCVSGNEDFFNGHFPQKKIMPGVLIIEALAQMGAVAVLSEEKYKNKLAIFAGIKNAKFRRPVVPGDTLVLDSRLIKVKGNFGISKAIATVDNEVACECEIMFTIV